MTDPGKKALEELVAGLDGVTPIFLVSAMVEKPGAFGHRAAAWPSATKAEALGTCLSMWQVDGWSVVSHEITECKTLVRVEDIAALEARATAAECELSMIADHLESGAADSDAILHTVREIEADRDILKERATHAEGVKEGLEMAARWHDERATFCMSRRWSKKAAMHQVSAASIRAMVNEVQP